MTVGSFVCLALYLILGAIVLSLAGRNKRWMLVQPAGVAAALLFAWPGIATLTLAARAPQFRPWFLDRVDDLADWFHVFIFSRFRR